MTTASKHRHIYSVRLLFHINYGLGSSVTFHGQQSRKQRQQQHAVSLAPLLVMGHLSIFMRNFCLIVGNFYNFLVERSAVA